MFFSDRVLSTFPALFASSLAGGLFPAFISIFHAENSSLQVSAFMLYLIKACPDTAGSA